MYRSMPAVPIQQYVQQQNGQPVYASMQRVTYGGQSAAAPIYAQAQAQAAPTPIYAAAQGQVSMAYQPGPAPVPISSRVMQGAPMVRTPVTGAVQLPSEAMRLLKEGNERYVRGNPISTRTNAKMRSLLVEEGQAPHTAIIGCADARAPLEKIFDAMPGDIFVLRNAGNTCTHAEGSMVGSLEFACGKLGSRLILVLGHTKCGAIIGATKTYLGSAERPKASSALEGLLADLGNVAEQAAGEMGSGATEDQIAAHAVKVNVFNTMQFLLKYSTGLRDLIRSGKVDLQGGIYELETGRVQFLGRHKDHELFLNSSAALPPSMMAALERESAQPRVRTAADSSAMEPIKALEELAAGNQRYYMGTPQAPTATEDMRKALVSKGQAPMAAIVGCSDSRAPVETIFDAGPGDLFILRNAGNTCTHAEGSIVGSLEFCVGKLGSRLVLVMGHTNCGALAGAAGTYLASKGSTDTQTTNSALEGLLQGLTTVAATAAEEMGGQATAAELAAYSVKVNVFATINFLLKFSQPIRDMVRNGELEIQGAVYELETGKVQFLGRSPKQEEVLSSKLFLPPSMTNASDTAVLLGSHGVRTPEDPPMEPKDALKLLKEGNERFAHGAPIAGKIDQQMRKALATVGQAPHTAVLGCADSRVPLELVFDTLPGDLFVLRNAGNTVVHSEGSVLGSLEFCVGALKTKLIVVLGHTACGAMKGAVKDYLTNKGTQRAPADSALAALLQGLNGVAAQAEAYAGHGAAEDAIATLAVKVNVKNTIDYLATKSATISGKVRAGEVTIVGGVYDLDTGRVEWLR